MSDAEDILNRGGLYLDELTRKLRLLHPDLHQLTQDISTDLDEYLEIAKNTEESAVKVSDNLKAVVDQANRQRMEVIAKRSQVLLESKEGTTAYQQVKATLQDRLMHLEQLNQEHESLARVEQELQDVLLWLKNK